MDINADGQIDLISGSWPGEIFLFKGGPGHTFGPREMIKDKNGHIINVGGGLDNRPGGVLIVAGSASVKVENGEKLILYHEYRIRIAKGGRVYVTGTASSVHAADWDGDGDLDLIVGDIRGTVSLVPNEGTAQAYRFGKARTLLAGGRQLRVNGFPGPFVADWDGDGKPDLLVGAGDGSVTFFRNTGTKHEPRFETGVTLVPAVQISFGPDAPKEPRRGKRSKICVADWNGDGRLDLLVGDWAPQAPSRPEPTPAEKVEDTRLRKEFDQVAKQYSDLADKLYGGSQLKDDKECNSVEKAMRQAMERMSALRGKLLPEYEDHGWIWLFLRKPGNIDTGASGGGSG